MPQLSHSMVFPTEIIRFLNSFRSVVRKIFSFYDLSYDFLTMHYSQNRQNLDV